MGMESRYIWMDGKLVEFANATVHFLNVGLHYGLSVFEGIRCYKTERGPAVFRLPEHTKRLIDSAHVLGMRNLPWSAEDVAQAITQTIAANEFEECYIRPVIWLGEGGWNINVDGGTPHLASPRGRGVRTSAKPRSRPVSARISHPTRAITQM